MQYFKKRSLRSDAKNLVHAAKNTLNYNRDLMEDGLVESFEGTIADLRRVVKRGSVAELTAAREAARGLIENAAPPVKLPVMRELVETLVVAFGVAMAFRAYFFQPFKIPTGSMQPTLFGMHSTTEKDPEKGPGTFDKGPLKPLKWLATGTWYKDVVAEGDGTATIAQDNVRAPGMVIITVAGKRHKVPQDALERGDIAMPGAQRPSMADNPNDSVKTLATSYVKKGDRIWAGYVTAGDQVFVNRMSWNFNPPRRDDVIVFATSSQQLAFTEDSARKMASSDKYITKIPNLPLYLVDTPIQPGLPAGQHYIKRLVGMPGERISVTHPHVYADGVKIENLFGMDRVASMGMAKTGGGRYWGYHSTLDDGTPHRSQSLLSTPDDSINLGEGEYLPMGDNTLSSSDGRYWGSVPEAQMLGPGSLIWWPLSPRWGRID